MMVRKPDSNPPVINQSKRMKILRETTENNYNTQVHKEYQVSCALIEHLANLLPIRIPGQFQIRLEHHSSHKNSRKINIL